MGLSVGTLLGIAFVYVFRVRWGAFPTSIFILSFFVNLILVFKINQGILKVLKRVRKKVVIIGEGRVDDIIGKRSIVERIKIDGIEKLVKGTDVDEIVICERIQSEKELNLLIYLIQQFKINVVFTPSVYLKLLPERINGVNSLHFLNTSIGRRPDVEEFLIRSLDILGSLIILFISAPITVLSSIMIKITSSGPILYKQKRVGKDGKVFTLYKFRTMVKDAEKKVGPILASRDDPRITKAGKLLRTTRLDELPQLYNVLRGDMSLVGPRPERPHFVKLHKSLRELRLTVRPGITGLAQIRNFYDLKPKHKIKYDYLYIQQRSLLLNLYTLAKTIPVIFSRKGW